MNAALQRTLAACLRLVDGYYAEVETLGGRRWDTSSLIKRLEPGGKR